MDPKEPGAQNPYRALLFKLTGVGVPRPRLKSAVNTWRKNQRDEIERAVRRVVLRDGTPRSQLATLRDSIARKIFETLPVEEQKQWGEFAKREHEVVLEIWKGVTTGEPSKEPADRQQYLIISSHPTQSDGSIPWQMYPIPRSIHPTHSGPRERGNRVACDTHDRRTRASARWSFEYY